ncbi:MAG: sigma-54-dependent Fis family transcriptional regulator [Magnetococcales bacterium]|nr:sigma-54-dependent Fis family transcriptional regulator [Magnetococcales bacterium]NGZ26729.1 sigma-54-dependent Fis family transcriptional regulator [Magnetococcales bacterium]
MNKTHQSGSILIIDDEPQILRIYKTLLTAESFQVETAGSMEEAIHWINQKEFHLIITDLRLPGKSGIDFIQELRARGGMAEVVVITGYPELDTAREAMRHGAMDYLTKPVFKEDLLRVCHNAIGHYRLKKQRSVLEKNMEAVIRSLRDGVIVLDGQRKILFANDAARQVCQLEEGCVGVGLEQALQRTAAQLRGSIAALLASDTLQTVTVPAMPGRHGKVISLCREALLDDGQNALGTIVLLKSHQQEHQATSSTAARLVNMIGQCAAMQRVFHLVETLAGLDTTVLITGESGTGKELVAEALHKLGNRSQHSMIAVNCAAIPDTLLESELFGHVRGSFTGAVKDHPGKLQQADKGTVFLDEIGDTSSAMQVRLLRYLEKREIQRLGEERYIQVNTRIIAATNRNLAERVKEGAFRQDLYYRLKVVEIHLPPLRERREDMGLLVDHYLGHFSSKFNKRITRLSPEVMALFMAYDWPGNIRELVHVLERAAILTSGEVVEPDAITLDQNPIKSDPPPPPQQALPESFDAYKINKDILLRALEKNRWNVTDTAKELGVSRTTIYRKMGEYGIDK